MEVFDFTEYKLFIEAQIKANSALWGYRTQLAAAAGCQKSFLSQVMISHVHLTPYHAIGLSEFWALNEGETDYFLALLEHARAGSPRLRARLEARMRVLKRDRKDMSKRSQADEIEERAMETLYHSSWYWAAIHILVSIPEYRTLNAIAERLELPVNLVSESLQHLERMGLVENKKGVWTITAKNIHLGINSPMRETNHAQWRQRALIDVQKKDADSVHYSAVFTMSRADAKRLAELVNEMILKSRDIVGPSPEEELYCLTSDFFKL